MTMTIWRLFYSGFLQTQGRSKSFWQQLKAAFCCSCWNSIWRISTVLPMPKSPNTHHRKVLKSMKRMRRGKWSTSSCPDPLLLLWKVLNHDFLSIFFGILFQIVRSLEILSFFFVVRDNLGSVVSNRYNLFCFAENLGMRSDSEESTKIALVKKYIEFKQLMLKIDPAEEDEEEKLASAMRAYQVPVSPTNATDSLVPLPTTAPIITPTMLPTLTLTPSKPRGRPPKTSRSPRSEQKSSSSSHKKKSHKKRKRKLDSDESSEDDSDCDPDFRGWNLKLETDDCSDNYNITTQSRGDSLGFFHVLELYGYTKCFLNSSEPWGIFSLKILYNSFLRETAKFDWLRSWFQWPISTTILPSEITKFKSWNRNWLITNAMICGTSCPILYTYKNCRFILNVAVDQWEIICTVSTRVFLMRQAKRNWLMRWLELLKTNQIACFLALLLCPTHRLLDSSIHRFLWIKFIFAHGFLKLVPFLLVGSIPSPSFPIPTTTVDEIANLFSHSFPSVISYFNSTLFVQETSSYPHSENLRESADNWTRACVCVWVYVWDDCTVFSTVSYYMDVRVYCIWNINRDSFGNVAFNYFRIHLILLPRFTPIHIQVVTNVTSRVNWTADLLCFWTYNDYWNGTCTEHS